MRMRTVLYKSDTVVKRKWHDLDRKIMKEQEQLKWGFWEVY
jgi:hypothetical protein